MHSSVAACVSVLLLVGVLTSAGQNVPGKAVPVVQEPLHHLALENKYTRVFKVEVPVGKQTLLHRHDHDYVFVTLGPAAIENAVQGKAVVKQTLSDGDTRYVRGRFAHVANNVGNAPFRNITIEILKPGPERPAMEERGMDIGHGSASEILVNNSKVRVEDVQIAAGGMLAATKLPRLIVAISECELMLAASGKDKSKHLAAGDVQWLPVGESLAAAPGSKQAHLISVEYR